MKEIREIEAETCQDEEKERPKLPPGTERILRRMEKLANPTPTEKRLAWFDRRKKKVRKVIRDFQALGIDAQIEAEKGAHKRARTFKPAVVCEL